MFPSTLLKQGIHLVIQFICMVLGESEEKGLQTLFGSNHQYCFNWLLALTNLLGFAREAIPRQ